MKYGIPDSTWDQAKAEMTAILSGKAQERAMITYSDLVGRMTTVSLDPRSFALASMLGEISVEEDAAGRGMLSVIVVHKYGDMQPGNGFYELAMDLGRTTKDRVACWVEELKKVFAYWR